MKECTHRSSVKPKIRLNSNDTKLTDMARQSAIGSIVDKSQARVRQMSAQGLRYLAVLSMKQLQVTKDWAVVRDKSRCRVMLGNAPMHTENLPASDAPEMCMGLPCYQL